MLKKKIEKIILKNHQGPSKIATLRVNAAKSAKTAKNDPKNGRRAKTVNRTGVYDTPKEPSFQIRKSQEKSGGVTTRDFNFGGAESAPPPV